MATYEQKPVKTYAEIEQNRKQNGYVIYDFFENPDPGIPDAYDIDGVWCKYFVNAPQGGADRFNTIKNRLYEYNFFNGVSRFKEIEELLKDYPSKLNHFRRLCTINIKGDETCRLMLFAGARINYDKLIPDVIEGIRQMKMGKDQKLSEVLHDLNGQVNAAALNGAFTKFCVSTFELEKQQNPLKEFDDQISDFYKGLINGSVTLSPPTPILIPTNPDIPFNLPQKLYENMKKLLEQGQNKGPLSRSDFVKILDSQKKMFTTERNNINFATIAQQGGRGRN